MIFSYKSYEEEERVADACFDLLQESDVQKDPCLATYLVLACEGIKDPLRKQGLKVMSKDHRLPSLLRKDIENILQNIEEKV